MKKLFLTFSLCFFSVLIFGQAPQSFSYQAVAYNSMGAVINTVVSLKISILDGSASATAVYSESFPSVTPDGHGIYSLNIGLGTVLSGTFATINWGNGAKFIKVEMDPTGTATTYTVVGTNQLMSVPYALYSINSSNGVEMVSNIDALRNLSVSLPQDENKVVYMKGYYTEADGGEGFFIYKNAETIPDKGGLFIKPITITQTPLSETPQEKGRWVRQYSGPINAIYFGVVKYPRYNPPATTTGTNYSNAQRINNAIEYVNNYNLGYLWGNPGGIINPSNERPQDMSIYLPSGSYYLDDTITLYKEVNIKGDLATRLIPTKVFKGDYVFEISHGPIEKFSLDKIEIDFGESKVGVGGIHFKAQLASGDFSAGAANGTIKGIRMRSLTGHGIYLEGGVGESGLEASQYLNFQDVFIERRPGNNNCLRITGASYNNVFLNCQFQIHFQKKVELSDTSSNIFISTTENIPQSKSGQIAFIDCATGGVPTKGVFFGAKIEKANNITFENCWFEDTEIAISVTNSDAINVQNCYFANAAGLGSLDIPSATNNEGACITVENSFVTIERCHSAVSKPNSKQLEKELFIRGIGDNNVINARNNSFQDIRLSNTFGITQYATVQNIGIPIYGSSPTTTIPGIEIGGKKIVLIHANKSNNTIKRINSTINAGETLFIRAENYELHIEAWNSSSETASRNIYLGSASSLTLTPGQGAYFLKLDGINNDEKCSYQLLSVTN